MMHKNPERVAWLVLLSAFAVFLALCALVPLSIRYYFLHSTTPKAALLEVIGGTVRAHERGAAAPIAVTQSLSLSEGSTVETDENSRGILTLLDGSTVILFPGTQIALREMRVSTFDWGAEPITLAIDQTRGRIRVGAAQPIPPGGNAPRARAFHVHTPQLAATLAEGSYVVEMSTDASQVIVRDGAATVTAQEQSVTVRRGQRTVVHRGEPPLVPLPAAQYIIVNGDFKDPLARGWGVVREAGSDPGIAPGSIDLTTLGERYAVHITRSDSKQTSANIGIVQQISREVSDYRSLRLAADIRLHYQSLSGGGMLSSEYPLILRLKYRDVYDSEAEWVHGFYYQNVSNNPTGNGESVPQDVWVPFESGNLFETLDPKPFFITSLQIYASGWDYDSYVSGVRLIVE